MTAAIKAAENAIIQAALAPTRILSCSVRWVYDSSELFSLDLEDELDEEDDDEEEDEADEADSFEVSAQGGLRQSLLVVWLLTAFDFVVMSSPTAGAGRALRNEDPPLANNRPLIITNKIVKSRKAEQDASFLEVKPMVVEERK